jgi:hypothetical protein
MSVYLVIFLIDFLSATVIISLLEFIYYKVSNYVGHFIMICSTETYKVRSYYLQLDMSDRGCLEKNEIKGPGF